MNATHGAAHPASRHHLCGRRSAAAAQTAIRRKEFSIFAIAAAWLMLAIPARAQSDPPQSPSVSPDLSSKSLEDLMNTEVTSVSKKGQKLSEVAAAIFVISQEDISRSGAMNIPDLLRMVPGMNVAQINGSSWAVSSRGFNEEFSDKLLVLLDGRAVYTPTFSGVFWDTLDVPLEDIDRIEVIRGPGATIWGVNAVNGVINILTKKASGTRGGFITSGYGTQLQGFGTAEYEDRLGPKINYRVFAKYLNVSDFPGANGQPSEDGWHLLRGGTRIDAQLSSKDALMLRGDIYSGEKGTIRDDVSSISPPVNSEGSAITSLSGGDVLGRWTETQSERSETSLLFYFDRYERRSSDEIDERRNTYDIEFQHHVKLPRRNDLVWGATYRNSRGETQGNLNFLFNPASHTSQFSSFFAQDEITVVSRRLFFTIGARWGWEDYSGYGVQPAARVLWTPTPNQAVWFAVSHAHRSPSVLETSVRQNLTVFLGPGGVPTVTSEFGNPKQNDEVLTSWELGYRHQFGGRVSLDFAAFFNRYAEVGSSEPLPAFTEIIPPPAHLVVASEDANGLYGETHGLEIAANWQVTSRWSLRSTYTLLEMHMHRDATSQDTETPGEIEGSDPRHRAGLRSYLNLGNGLSWDVSADFVDRLRAQGVPSYTRLNSGLSWQVRERFTVTIAGQNLLRDHHQEFADPFGTSIADEVKRSTYIKLAWRF